MREPMDVELLVIGGGPAGLSAARGFREAGGKGPVVMASADEDPPYVRPLLSKEFLRAEAGEDDLPMQPLSFYDEYGIDLHCRHEIVALDPIDHLAVAGSGRRYRYSRCVLATGARPATPPVPGADDERVHLLRSAVLARVLRSTADIARDAVVVGSGFIGCEVAASLAARGLTVTMLAQEAVPQQQRLGREAGGRIARWLVDMGVRHVGDAEVEKVVKGREVHIAGSAPHRADMVLLATGISPRITLARDAGIATAESRIVVDEAMRTDREDLYAAGDVAYARNGIAGRHLMVQHWGEAEAMGEIAGNVAAGGDMTWRQAPGFWSAIGDQTIKHVAWGDGHDEVRFVDHGAGAFTAWYGSSGITVGVLTHDADEDYSAGRELVESGAPLPRT